MVSGNVNVVKPVPRLDSNTRLRAETATSIFQGGDGTFPSQHPGLRGPHRAREVVFIV